MCSHPVIIVNPNLYSLLSVYGNYHVNGSCRVLSRTERFKCECRMSDLKFSSNLLGVTIDNIDNYFVCDEKSGETFPMFLAVPCGKCELCRNKRSLDWETRCFLETQTSPSKPLFFTLTYQNSELPLIDNKYPTLVKKDIQLFMKRFRINLKRAGYDSEGIRYYICGEYGSKSGRPHYHGLFWNLPYIKPNEWHNFTDCLDYSWNKGFTMVSPAGKGAGKYCLKYMRKGSNKPNKYCEKEFYLSSRRKGGLGYQWLKDNFSYFLSHPEITCINVKDKFSDSNKINTFAIPEYFKTKLYPTLSRLIPKNVRDAYKLFLYSVGSCFSLSSTFRNSFISGHITKIRDTYTKVCDYFSKLPTFFNPNRLVFPDSIALYPHYLIKHYDIKHDVNSDKAGLFEFLQLICNINKTIPILLDFLNNAPEIGYITGILDYRNKHRVYLERYLNAQPEVDLEYKKRILQKRYYQSLHKEIF